MGKLTDIISDLVRLRQAQTIVRNTPNWSNTLVTDYALKAEALMILARELERIEQGYPWVYIGQPGAPVYQNGYQAYNAEEGIRYRFVDANNIHVTGIARRNPTQDGTLFQFPAPFQPRFPKANVHVGARSSDGGAPTYSFIAPSGDFRVASTGRAGWVMVDQVIALREPP